LRVTRIYLFAFFAMLLAILAGTPACAQDAPAPAPVEQEIDFTANALNYDSELDVVTATGDVRMTRGGEKLRADKVVWNRKTGDVRADGNVAISNSNGDLAYGDGVALKDTLRDGVVDNFLIVLKDGGRLAATHGVRNSSVTTLDRAAYTPCVVVDEAGCPKEPVWKITALEVIHDPVVNRVRYRNAQLSLFGTPIVTIPKFSHAADRRGATGVLIPDIRYTENNGFEFALPYYFHFNENRDLTVTPHVFTGVLPAVEANYRALTKKGAYQIGGYATYGRLIPTAVSGTASQRSFRGYFDATGKFQLSPRWSVKSSLRATTDRTFLRRYDISRDDRLRSMVDVERVTRTSYFSVSGWAFQTLRAGERQGRIPIALPIIDYRKRFDDPLAGGRVELQVNSVALTRTAGQDTQRAFAGARWDLRRVTGLGQEVQFTGYARGDIYHSDQISSTATIPYRGTAGVNGRFVAAAAMDVRWPFVGKFLNGTQRLTPRIQIVASPRAANLKVPNEDARAVDLEDSNLFALNRFAGYDRWEDGTRLTYGIDWGWSAPNWQISANVGQSYRLSSKPSLFPDGTGLTSRTSDVVGRTSVKYKSLISLTHRYRIDKDTYAIRRNELDATVGSATTYGTIGYLRLNRNIGPQLEDLRDREEIRLGGRVQLAKHWSAFGSTIIDLTGKNDDAAALTDGYEPIRHRFGFAYDDDCVSIGLTWKRDYDASGDARRGNTFVLRLSFRNLGR
jgi:LPS-assembly protein